MAKWFIEITLRKNIQHMKRSILALVLLGTLAATAPAAVTILNPSVDGWAKPGASPSSNDNSSDPLTVKASGTGSGKMRTYLRFALPSLPGATINSASLVLNLTQAPSQSRTYNLYKSTAAIPDAWGGVNIFIGVPASSNLANTTTGTTVGVDRTWTGAPLKVAVQDVTLAGGGDLALVVADSDENGQGYEGHFASNENATAAIRPRLIIDYTPVVDCATGSVTIFRHDYSGPNPLPWDVTTSQAFDVSFTVSAECKDLHRLKVQGGLAANTQMGSTVRTCTGNAPCVTDQGIGTVGINIVGGGKNNVNNRGNNVITWNIPDLAANTSATLTVTVMATLNVAGKPACGVKGFTGGWTVSGFWNNGGVLENVADGPTGGLVVDVSCPLP